MIYSYLKMALENRKDNPEECRKIIYEAEKAIEKVKREHDNTWRYCLGCKGYVKRAEACEDEYKGKVVLRCCNCHAIIEFPDYNAYLD